MLDKMFEITTVCTYIWVNYEILLTRISARRGDSHILHTRSCGVSDIMIILPETHPKGKQFPDHHFTEGCVSFRECKPLILRITSLSASSVAVKSSEVRVGRLMIVGHPKKKRTTVEVDSNATLSSVGESCGFTTSYGNSIRSKNQTIHCSLPWAGLKTAKIS